MCGKNAAGHLLDCWPNKKVLISRLERRLYSSHIHMCLGLEQTDAKTKLSRYINFLIASNFRLNENLASYIIRGNSRLTRKRIRAESEGIMCSDEGYIGIKSITELRMTIAHSFSVDSCVRVGKA